MSRIRASTGERESKASQTDFHAEKTTAECKRTTKTWNDRESPAVRKPHPAGIGKSVNRTTRSARIRKSLVLLLLCFGGTRPRPTATGTCCASACARV